MIELTARQLQIVELVKAHAPITGEQIAELLGLSRPTLRSDLALLVMLGLVDAKPKVGYTPGSAMTPGAQFSRQLNGLKVKDVQAIPIVIREQASVNDAVVMLFLENVGNLIVVDEQGRLSGIISRKDLLKFTLGNPNAAVMPVSMVMTREPNVIHAAPEESVVEAARKMIKHQVDSLPVVVPYKDSNGKEQPRWEVTGRITKTIMTKVLLDLAMERL
ncbi:helix-turn-helix transcriptional regulator [Paenibacillus filicis]|uniref:Helix-turn-helix transcriptional regulator n=1 Tax=Paenibacillus gyeongsangnamensis TaxID=3388067 RepID=A0ABT4QLK8_9BACL|nr:helix-turn-helix transcriptional regulator [Paenibacillus filicis]MCZ8517757.1 helix-turn-helix transcriptional regulator [Paenibacillus filicis]